MSIFAVWWLTHQQEAHPALLLFIISPPLHHSLCSRNDTHFQSLANRRMCPQTRWAHVLLHSLVESLLVHHVLSEDIYGFKNVHLILVVLYQLPVAVTQTHTVKNDKLWPLFIGKHLSNLPRIRAMWKQTFELGAQVKNCNSPWPWKGSQFWLFFP